MNVLNRIWNRLNPLQEGIDKGEKYSRILLLIFTFFALLNVYDLLVYVVQLIKYPMSIDWGFLSAVSSFLLLPIVLYVFSTRRNLGWLLFAGFLFYMLFSVSYNFTFTLLLGPSEYSNAIEVSTVSLINFKLLLYMLLSAGSLVLIYNSAVKKMYHVKSNQAVGVLVFGLALFALLAFSLFG